MKIAGLQKFSLIDYPGKLSLVVFTQGCAFRCHYCHNKELVLQKHFTSCIDEQSLYELLEKRKGKLDAVVFSGGEPTLQKDLQCVIEKIKEDGWLVKLDSSGVRPKVLHKLLDKNLLDFIAMDIKAPLNKYSSVTAVKNNVKTIEKSIELIISSGIQHEFRSTVLPFLHSKENILSMAKAIKGAQKFVLQRFRPQKTLNPDFGTQSAYSKDDLFPLKTEIESYVQECLFRSFS